MLNQARPWPRGHAKPSSTMTPGSSQIGVTTPIKIINFYSWGAMSMTAPQHLAKLIWIKLCSILLLDKFYIWRLFYESVQNIPSHCKCPDCSDQSINQRLKDWSPWDKTCGFIERDLRLRWRGNITWKVCWCIRDVWQNIVIVIELTVH